MNDANYIVRADHHRPGVEQVRAQAIHLFLAGLTTHDVGASLRVDERQVRAWIEAAVPANQLMELHTVNCERLRAGRCTCTPELTWHPEECPQ